MCADVTSANIVGYQKKSVELCGGTFIYGSDFLTTGTSDDSFSIQSIVPSWPEESVEEYQNGDCVIQTLTENAVEEESYYYLFEEGAKGYEGPGWYTRDGGNYTKSNRTFKRGEAYLFYSYYACDDEDEDIPTGYQTAGEVNLTAKTFTFGEGLCGGTFCIANPRPLELDIQKFVPSYHPDSVEEYQNGDCVIQTLTENAVEEESYYYLFEEGAKGYEGPGWYTRDGGNYTKANKKFAPAEGFLFYSYYACDDNDDDLPTYLTINE